MAQYEPDVTVSIHIIFSLAIDHLFTHPFFHIIKEAQEMASNECLLRVMSLGGHFYHLISTSFLQSRPSWPILELRIPKIREVEE